MRVLESGLLPKDFGESFEWPRKASVLGVN